MKPRRKLLVYLALLSVVVAAIAFVWSRFGQPRGEAHEVSIRGRVTRDGKPLAWDGEPGTLLVVFRPAEPIDLTIFLADCDAATGTFSIARLPRGRYKINVAQLESRSRHDLLKGAFDPARSPLECEVTRDGQEIPIDLPTTPQAAKDE
ncbi:MAG: hypothetical protein ACJ8F7_12885 [Gemmataceae bacterium]